jgi:hypothetical protein
MERGEWCDLKTWENELGRGGTYMSERERERELQHETVDRLLRNWRAWRVKLEQQIREKWIVDIRDGRFHVHRLCEGIRPIAEEMNTRVESSKVANAINACSHVAPTY